MNTVCRLCGSENTSRKYRLCSDMRIMGETFRGGDCYISRCSDCGFVFNTYSDAGQASFTGYYRSGNSKTVNYYDVYPKEQADAYLQHLAELVGKCAGDKGRSARILDIAGGYGEVSLYLKKSGYDKVTMTEIKEDCISAVREKGIEVLECDMLEKNLSEVFDIVICSHDLEHMVDVSDAMCSAVALLAEDGRMILELPYAPWYKEMENTPYHFLTYEHVCHFSDITVRNLASLSGTEIMDSGHYVKCNDYPCVWALLKRKKENHIRIEKDDSLWNDINDYRAASDEQMKRKLEAFIRDQKPLILWGIGASTAQLMNGAFNGCNVVQLIDKNEARQGNVFEINGKKLTVMSPETITNPSATIFILPSAYRNSIERDIRNLGFQNKVMCLEE